MKREIKFRFWDTQLFKIIDGDMMFINDYSDSGTASLQSTMEGMNDRYEIMQFTGLKDKNGKEIYEGDIVKDNVIHVMRNINDKDIYEVYYWEGCASIKNVLDPTDNEYLWDYHRVCEVIGNIYENPELVATSR